MPSIAEAALRHARYYAQVLTAAHQGFMGGGDAADRSLRVFDEERAQTDAAWSWLLSEPADQTIDDLCIQYGVASLQLGAHRYHPAREHLPKLEAALAAAQRGAAPSVISALQTGLGRVYTLLGAMSAASEQYRQAMAISRTHADAVGLARALGALGGWYVVHGEYATAQAYLEEGLALSHTDQREHATMLRFLGVIAYNRGDYSAAHRFCEHSLAIFTELQDNAGIGAALVTLGNVAHQQGEKDRALRLHQEALTIHRSMGNKRLISASLQCLGFIATSSDDPAARGLYQEALALNTELGNKDGQALNLYTLAYAAFKEADLEAADAAINQCLALRHELGDTAGRASALIIRALLALCRGNPAEARGAGAESLRLAEGIGKYPAMIEAHDVLSGAHRALGQGDAARTHAEQALRLAYTITNTHLMFMALVQYVRVMMDLDPDRTARLLPHLRERTDSSLQRLDPYYRVLMNEIAAYVQHVSHASTLPRPEESLEDTLRDMGLIE
jgi:tetratricopeptide (TPR) repeat protein